MAAGVAGAGFVLSLFPAPAASARGRRHEHRARRRARGTALVGLARRGRAGADERDLPEERARFRERVAERSGVDISPGAIWALIRIDEHGLARARAMALEDGVDPARIAQVLDELRRRGLIAGEDGSVQVTPAGETETRRVVDARRLVLTEALADEDADRRPEVSALLTRLSRELCGELPSARSDAAPAMVG